jgi:SAM-dependent methyltransferase
MNQVGGLGSVKKMEEYVAQEASSPENQLRWARERDRVATWISQFCKGGTLLDVGCLNGDLMRSESFPAGLQYYGIDPYLIKGFTYDFNFRCEALETTSFPDESFDIIVIKDGIDYFLSAKNAFAAAFRLLKRGGYFLLSEAGHPFERPPPWIILLRSLKGYARAVVRRDYPTLAESRQILVEHSYPNGDIPTSELLRSCTKVGFRIVSDEIETGRLFLAAMRPPR